MKNNLDIILFGTFGNPNGYRQSSITNNNYAKIIPVFELDNTYLKIIENELLYSLRKEKQSSGFYISYSKYLYTKEPKSTRDGTFIGSSLVLKNNLLNFKIAFPVVDNILSILISNSKNIINKTFQVNHSDKFEFNITQINDFDKIDSNLVGIDKWISDNFNNLKAIVLLNDENIHLKIDKLNKLLIKYDLIYFTSSHRLFTYTKDKGSRLIKCLTESEAFSEMDSIERRLREQEEINKKKKLDEEKRKQQEEIERQEKEKIKKWESKQLNKNDLNDKRKQDDIIEQVYYLQSKIRNQSSNVQNQITNYSNHNYIEYPQRQSKSISKKSSSIIYALITIALLVGIAVSAMYFLYHIDLLEEEHSTEITELKDEIEKLKLELEEKKEKAVIVKEKVSQVDLNKTVEDKTIKQEVSSKPPKKNPEKKKTDNAQKDKKDKKENRGQKKETKIKKIEDKKKETKKG